MWVKGESSCQQFLDPSDDLWWRCRILNNGRRSAFVIDKRCVQDKGNCSCLKLPAKITAVTAKDGGCKAGNVGQVEMRVLGQHGVHPLCLEHSSQRWRLPRLERNRCRVLMMPIATNL